MPRKRPAKESVEKSIKKRDNGKRKCTNSHNIHIPNKARVEKSCALCQKYGGAHTTHNTSECRKYKKDGTLQKSFSGKRAVRQRCHGSSKNETANSFAQILECFFSKLEKTVKKEALPRKQQH